MFQLEYESHHILVCPSLLLVHVQFASDVKFELYKALDLHMPHLTKGAFVRLLNLHPPESKESRSCIRVLFFPISHSPPGLSTIKTLFKTWLAASFPTFNQGTLKAIQYPYPAKKPMGDEGPLADTKTHCGRHL